jgi:hypothetical protein
MQQQQGAGCLLCPCKTDTGAGRGSRQPCHGALGHKPWDKQAAAHSTDLPAAPRTSKCAVAPTAWSLVKSAVVHPLSTPLLPTKPPAPGQLQMCTLCGKVHGSVDMQPIHAAHDCRHRQGNAATSKHEHAQKVSMPQLNWQQPAPHTYECMHQAAVSAELALHSSN